MKLYDRVQFADETQGLILSREAQKGRTFLVVLTDDYERVICDPDQVGVIERVEREDDHMRVLEDYVAGGQTYRLHVFEVNFLNWYRMAIWHDYWTKHPQKDGVPPMGVRKQPEYWEWYQRGEIAHLPPERDIRRSEALPPTQASMDIGATRHDH